MVGELSKADSTPNRGDVRFRQCNRRLRPTHCCEPPPHLPLRPLMDCEIQQTGAGGTLPCKKLLQEIEEYLGLIRLLKPRLAADVLVSGCIRRKNSRLE